jgi:1,4-dihydroxy-2-naphthoate polyprenyltransferase
MGLIMNVLVINGHPRKGSYSEAISNAYAEGATIAGTNVTILNLYELAFEPNVIVPSPAAQFHEEDITRSKKLIGQADHVVFVFPTWWGTMPALLKGFTDRVFTEGWAFEEIEGGTGYAPLLNGKSALLITTMDTPKFVYKLIYRSPGYRAMSNALLKFCGFSSVKMMSIGEQKKKDQRQHEAWLERVKEKGKELRKGNFTNWEKFKIKTGSWIKAIRLQFYPMTFIAYTTGAMAAKAMGFGFDSVTFWLGYLWLFFLEVATVLSNEYFDYRSDISNKFFGPFTGGSRVLVEKKLGFSEVRAGIGITLLFSIAALFLLFSIKGNFSMQNLVVCAIVFVITLGYTIPPLKLSWRGLGELTVGFTHSAVVIICGYIFQGGGLTDKFPWWISLPLFLSVLPSIILAGIPDYEADKSSGKGTLAVRLGIRNAARLAIFFSIAAALMVIFLKNSLLLTGAYGNLIYIVIPHSILLVYLLVQFLKKENQPRRIDGLLIASLTYLVWFALLPMIKLI